MILWGGVGASLGDYSVPCSINGSHLVEFSQWEDWAGGSQVASFAYPFPWPIWLEGWAQLE